MSLRLSGDQFQPQHSEGVGESRLFHALHGAADLGDVMARVIDVLIGDFDGRHEASVTEVAGCKEINSLVGETL